MLWDDFINTYWRDWRGGDRSKDRDNLEDREWLRRWLIQRGLHEAAGDAHPDEKELSSLKELRSLLFGAVRDISGQRVPESATLERLNAYMARGPVTRSVVLSGPGGTEETTAEADIAAKANGAANAEGAAEGAKKTTSAHTAASIRMEWKPARTGWDAVMAEIAASFAKTLAEGEPSRFRICDNPDCLWAYYDDTRNRSKRYCDDKACGNLMKVRRFRAKKKAERETE